MLIAVIRPDSWDFPLLLHVLGAMLMVGSLVLAGAALLVAWRDGSVAMVRLGYRSLLLGVVPSWILTRAGAEWIASKEGLENSNVAWIGIGYSTSDVGALLIIIATLLAGFGLRRQARAPGSNGLGRASAVIVSLLVIVYVVTIWAMTTKPS
ncbi:MAG TPA: hypothetical protein VGI67_12610 [Thermoleophilaceae bacterium]